MSFKKLDLHPNILQAIEKCGYTKPTPVQLKSIPNILDRKDIVASAQTGTGKTAAYVLPALQLLSTKKSRKNPTILILAPTRELAGQITKVITKYSKFMKVNVASFVGGESYQRQFKALSRPLDIIIATPGRLMDHMENKRLDLSHIEMLIVDEADRMLDMGFIDDIKTIMQTTPGNRQTLLFSATVEDKLVSTLKGLLKNPVRINVSEDKVDTTLITQKIHMVTSPKYKKALLEDIIESENIFKAIIFSSTKINAGKLADHLKDLGYSAAPIHGDLKQSARNRTLTKFRKGEVQFLVATDVAARGIDVMDITHVINYDLPRFTEDYVHRIGRTGRAGKAGVAISIADKTETHHIRKIERYIKTKIQAVRLTEKGEEVVFFVDDSDGKPQRKRTNKKNYGKRQGRSDSKRTSSKDKPKHRGSKSDSKNKSKSRGPKSDSRSKDKTRKPRSEKRPDSRGPNSDSKSRNKNPSQKTSKPKKKNFISKNKPKQNKLKPKNKNAKKTDSKKLNVKKNKKRN